MARAGGREGGKETERRMDIAEAVQNLRELRTRERGEQADPAEQFAEAIESVPSSVRESIRGKLVAEREELIEAGVEPTAADRIIGKRAEKEALTFRETFLDKRFLDDGLEIPKDEYAKAEVQDEIDRILANDPKPDDLKRVARVAFDANGLKAANDLAGHEAGNAMLLRIAQVLDRGDGPTRRWLKEQGVEKVLATTGGGDEYGLLLVSEKPIDPAVIAEAIGRYEAEVAAIDMGDVVDFDDEAVLMRFAGIPEAEARRMSGADRAATLAKARTLIPPGARFPVSVSGGGATLADGLEHALSQAPPDRRLSSEDSYRRSLQKIMGGIWDAADANAIRSKAEFKAALRESKDPTERFTSQLLARTAESREAERVIADQADKLARARATLRELTGMIDAMETAGLSPADLKKSLEEKLRQLEV